MQTYFDLLNRFFDQIYVITLRRATDRHLHIQTELQGLDYKLFFGKDKNRFAVEELEQKGIYSEALAKQHHRYGKPMTPGMIGCSWSHRLVYEDVVSNGFEKVLILEDDVVIDQRYISLLPKLLKEFPKDWELVYLGFAGNDTAPKNASFKKAFYHLLHALGAFKYSHKTIKNLYPKKVSRHLYKAGYHDCTHAYALTLTGAKKLVQLQTPISFFPDNLLAHAVTEEIVKGYITIPKIINQQYQVAQQPTYSYINQ